MRQITHNLVEEARVVTELHLDAVQVLLSLMVSANANAVISDQEMKLEDELKDLVQSDLQAVVSSSREEAFLKDRVKVGVVKADQLFKVVDLGELLLQ